MRLSRAPSPRKPAQIAGPSAKIWVQGCAKKSFRSHSETGSIFLHQVQRYGVKNKVQRYGGTRSGCLNGSYRPIADSQKLTSKLNGAGGVRVERNVSHVLFQGGALLSTVLSASRSAPEWKFPCLSRLVLRTKFQRPFG